MAKFKIVEVLMADAKQMKSNESLELDQEVDTIVGLMSLDLDRIEAYAPIYDGEGEILEGECMVNTYSGMELRLKYSFKRFHEMMTKD